METCLWDLTAKVLTIDKPHVDTLTVTKMTVNLHRAEFKSV